MHHVLYRMTFFNLNKIGILYPTIARPSNCKRKLPCAHLAHTPGVAQHLPYRSHHHLTFGSIIPPPHQNLCELSFSCVHEVGIDDRFISRPSNLNEFLTVDIKKTWQMPEGMVGVAPSSSSLKSDSTFVEDL